MQNAAKLSQGMFADLANDWRVYIIEADAHHAGVLYVGPYPYDEDGTPLHPQCPEIAATWVGKAPGARQVSVRQKRIEQFTADCHFEPVLQRRFA